MRVLICGGRTFGNRHEHIAQFDVAMRQVPADATIIHGGATGADTLAHQFAIATRRKLQVFKARWDIHGRKAGPLRNREMLKSGVDLVIAFWDGSSRGTADMIGQAREAKVNVIIYYHGVKPTNGS